MECFLSCYVHKRGTYLQVMSSLNIKVDDKWVSVSPASFNDFKNMGINEFHVCEKDVNLLLRKILFTQSSVDCTISKSFNEGDCFTFKFKK